MWHAMAMCLRLCAQTHFHYSPNYAMSPWFHANQTDVQMGGKFMRDDALAVLDRHFVSGTTPASKLCCLQQVLH